MHVAPIWKFVRLEQFQGMAWFLVSMSKVLSILVRSETSEVQQNYQGIPVDVFGDFTLKIFCRRLQETGV